SLKIESLRFVLSTAPALTSDHRTLASICPRTWIMVEWERVLFSESRLSLRSLDGRERVWRRIVERYAACAFSDGTAFNGGSIMVQPGAVAGRHDFSYFPKTSANGSHTYVDPRCVLDRFRTCTAFSLKIESLRFVLSTAPALTSDHRTLASICPRTWIMVEWERVLFSESRLSLRSLDGRERVWRRIVERYAACAFSDGTAFNGDSIMVQPGAVAGRHDFRVTSRRRLRTVHILMLIPVAFWTDFGLAPPL
ncbi:hypothetical protein ANN_05268, partial [Periplaneta americana]